jgi:transcriptional regulator with PAS, ATPase and Fis domain
MAGLICIAEIRAERRPHSLWLAIALAGLIQSLLQQEERLRARPKISAPPGTAPPAAPFTFADLIGKSPLFLAAVKQAQKLAPTEEAILLGGESGVGKDLFAQAIHNASRPGGPFVALNCAGLAKSLIESELFGYEGGSFTGAAKEGRPGKIELADQGTLFLDEIGDMPLDLQPVLLRVLETKQVLRVGGQRQRAVDFRVIAATNRNLGQLIRERGFRPDLFYRLATLTVSIPPLRERSGDIIPLVRHFISKNGGGSRIMEQAAYEALLRHSWPGNARELERAVIYALQMAEGPELKVGDLPPAFGSPRQDAAWAAPDASLAELEERHIRNVMRRCRNNTEQAALILGIDRSTLYRKLKRLDFDCAG